MEHNKLVEESTKIMTSMLLEASKAVVGPVGSPGLIQKQVIQEHSTKGGSLVLGTNHSDSEHGKAVLERGKAHLNSNSNRHTVIRTEGTKGGHPGSVEHNTHNELVKYAKENGISHSVESAEHPDNDMDNPDSKLVQGLHGTHGEGVANATLFMINHGSGEQQPGRAHKASEHHLTPEARKHLQGLGFNEGKNGTYTAAHRREMFHRVNPRDRNPNAEPTAHSEINDHIQSERRASLHQHIENDEAEGHSSLVTFGEGHISGLNKGN